MRTIQTFLEQNAFKDVLRNVRKEVNKIAKNMSEKVRKDFESEIQKFVRDKGYEVRSIKIGMGKFRGSHFVRSCLLQVSNSPPFENEKDDYLKDLVKDLKNKYHHKFKVKSVVDGVATINIT